MKKALKEKQLNREVEQDKRYLTFGKDKDSLEVWKLESDNDERFRVDNLLTNGAYIINLDSGKFTCDCPDYIHNCSKFTPPIRCKHILAVENWKARGVQVKAGKKQSFDPNKHLIKIKGKDYLEVKFRLKWFRQDHEDWDVNTSLINFDYDKGFAVVRADIYNAEGKHMSSGLGDENRKNFSDYLRKAETVSIGRALSALGYGTLQASELEEGRIVDAPVSLGGSNGKNGNGRIKVQVFKPSGIIGNGKVNGTNGTNGSSRGGNGREQKASMRQVRYIKDLCKDLGEKPQINIAGLSMENASMIIEGLQKELQERRKK